MILRPSIRDGRDRSGEAPVELDRTLQDRSQSAQVAFRPTAPRPRDANEQAARPRLVRHVPHLAWMAGVSVAEVPEAHHQGWFSHRRPQLFLALFLGYSPHNCDLRVRAHILVSVTPGFSTRCTRTSVFLPLARRVWTVDHFPLARLVTQFVSVLGGRMGGRGEWCQVAQAAAIPRRCE